MYVLYERREDTLVYITFGSDKAEIESVKQILELSSPELVFEIKEVTDEEQLNQIINNAEALNKMFM